VNADRMLADAKTVDPRIRQSESEANTYGVNGTPSFVVNGKLLALTSLQPGDFNTALAAALGQ